MAEYIGKTNITVRRFDPKTFVDGNIYSDFLSAIGLSMTDEYKISETVKNPGLYGNTHELKRVLNSLPQMQETAIQDFIRDRLLECSDQSAADYPCEMFSKEETIAFLKQFEEDNNRIAQEYLHEPNGQLFDNTVKDSPKWQKDNPYMLDDLTRFVGTTAIWLYQENQQMKKQIKLMEKQIRELQKQPKTPPQTAPAANPTKKILRRVKRALTINRADVEKTVENN